MSVVLLPFQVQFGTRERRFHQELGQILWRRGSSALVLLLLKRRQSVIEHFLGVTKVTARDLRLYDALLFRLEVDCHLLLPLPLLRGASLHDLTTPVFSTSCCQADKRGSYRTFGTR